ncbi:hypothetical protein [Corynebacterium lowii]|uniref:Uncharacterized protein n=1 Tax=Corynebacterium lowii TaxID=1544413 RepID=A0A0Q0UL62_9CORY|nr:hypothetical protein [Corynebacterium lowii]KQB87062.1 hypothetical protein Clow_00109 [Corynebacterium lowii]MDP9852354.1 hypothetical protein [Corynebacterium lowii]
MIHGPFTEELITTMLNAAADSYDGIALIADGAIAADELDPDAYDLAGWTEEINTFIAARGITLDEFHYDHASMFWSIGANYYNPEEPLAA